MEGNKTFNISMPASLLNSIDKQAEVEFRNRSDLIREAVRTYIVQKGGMSDVDRLTHDEKSRLENILNFAGLLRQPAIIFSASYRPQPNSIIDIFSADSAAINLIEHPPKLRQMGWDLETLDRARLVAGEYLEVQNGNRKQLRVYRDGQQNFIGGMDFFGHGVNRNKNVFDTLNLLSVAEFIMNFVIFSTELANALERDAESAIFTIAVNNPRTVEREGHHKLILNAPQGNSLTDEVGDGLDLEWVEQKIVVNGIRNRTRENIAYLILAEFCYFFGLRSDQLPYVNKVSKELNSAQIANWGS